MAQPARPWTQAIKEYLAEHPGAVAAELVAVGSRHVDPTRAWRMSERVRRNASGTPERVRARDQETLVRSGARTIVRAALHSLVRNQSVERRGDRFYLREPDRVEYRCERCGATTLMKPSTVRRKSEESAKSGCRHCASKYRPPPTEEAKRRMSEAAKRRPLQRDRTTGRFVGR